MKIARNVLLEPTKVSVVINVLAALPLKLPWQAVVAFLAAHAGQVITGKAVRHAFLELTKISSGLTVACSVQVVQAPEWLGALPCLIVSADQDTQDLSMDQPARRAQLDFSRLWKATCRALNVVLVRTLMA